MSKREVKAKKNKITTLIFFKAQIKTVIPRHLRTIREKEIKKG